MQCNDQGDCQCNECMCRNGYGGTLCEVCVDGEVSIHMYACSLWAGVLVVLNSHQRHSDWLNYIPSVELLSYSTISCISGDNLV